METFTGLRYIVQLEASWGILRRRPEDQRLQNKHSFSKSGPLVGTVEAGETRVSAPSNNAGMSAEQRCYEEP